MRGENTPQQFNNAIDKEAYNVNEIEEKAEAKEAIFEELKNRRLTLVTSKPKEQGGIEREINEELLYPKVNGLRKKGKIESVVEL